MLSATSQVFWETCLTDSEEAYKRYLKATPLGRLEVQVRAREPEENWSRLASVTATMLMDSLPKALVKTEIISKRRFTVSEILFAVLRIYQPGGIAEKASVLDALKGISPSSEPEGALERIREWRRKVVRAEELRLVLPDPSLLYRALMQAVTQVK